MERSLVAVTCGLLVACSATHQSECPQLGAYLAFEAEMRRAECAVLTRCYNDGTGPTRFYLSLDACAGGYSRSPDDLCADLAEGRLDFHADRIAACMDALSAEASAACAVAPEHGAPAPNVWSGWVRPCDEVLTLPPWVEPPLEGDCLQRGCPSGAACLVEDGTCGARCVPLSTVGGPCLPAGCSRGLHCDYATETCQTGCGSSYDCDDGLVCIEHACVARSVPMIGEPCLPPSAITRCQGTLSYCNAGTQRCDTQALADETCDAGGGHDACVAGTCDPATRSCVPDARCFPRNSDFHDTCTPSAPWCDSEHCTADASRATCDVIGPAEGVEQCPTGLGCDLRGLDLNDLYQPCRPRAELGAPCDDAVICVDGTSCASGRCTVLAGLDEPCDAEHVCPVGLLCRDATCTAIEEHAIGEPCESDANCWQGGCRDRVCAWLEGGAVCTSSRQCRDDLFGCDHGRCTDTEVVADGEQCDFSHRFCADGAYCMRAANLDGRFVVDVCARPCPTP